MQHRYLAVVALEEGEEIAGEVKLVTRVERADDTEVDGGVARVLRVADVDEDVAGMHVGVEEIVPEHLREEDLDAVLGELRDVRAQLAQARDFRDLDAADALHDHDVLPAQVP